MMALQETSSGGGGSIYGTSPYGSNPANSITGKQKGNITQAVQNVAGALSGPAPEQYPYGGQSSKAVLSAFPNPPYNAKNPQIWMGSSAPIAFMSASDAGQMYYQWDAKTKNQFLYQLALAGYNTDSIRDSQLQQLWAGYVNVAASYQANGKQISPWDALGKDIAQHTQAQAKPKTVTQTQKTYNISTAEDAAALFQGAAQTLLGRDPTKSEQSRFKQILNKYEQAHPAETTTTSNYLGADLQSQSSTSTGGVSAAAQQYIAQEESKKNPEYGAYQAATNGMNWLLGMIGGP